MYERELEIQRMMAEGRSKVDICDIMAKKYGVSGRTVEAQYYRIVKGIQQTVEEGRAEIRATLMARNDHIYRLSLAEGKHKTALDAIQAQAKLAGLYEAEKIETKRPDIIEVESADYSKPLEVIDGAKSKKG